ncbi:36552_t:CDS:1, partial [Racocetra persica]
DKRESTKQNDINTQEKTPTTNTNQRKAPNWKMQNTNWQKKHRIG